MALAFAVCLAAALLPSCGDAGPAGAEGRGDQGPGKAGPASVRFVTGVAPIEFTFPPDWRDERDGHPFDLQCVSGNSQLVTNVFVYARADMAASSTPASFLTRQVQDLEGRRANFKLLSEEESYEDETRRFKTVTYTGEVDASANCYRFSLIEFKSVPDYFAVVLQTGFPEDWAEVEPFLDRIVLSARLLPHGDGEGGAGDTQSSNPADVLRLSGLAPAAIVDASVTDKTFHVFSGQFESRAEACGYTEAQWERPAPDDSWSDAEWEAYEERNPTWALKNDLAVGYMDSDFIETIDGAGRIEYLRDQLQQAEDFEGLHRAIPDEHNILVLILSSAFDGREVELSSTPKLSYHGEFPWRSYARRNHFDRAEQLLQEK